MAAPSLASFLSRSLRKQDDHLCWTPFLGRRRADAGGHGGALSLCNTVLGRRWLRSTLFSMPPSPARRPIPSLVELNAILLLLRQSISSNSTGPIPSSVAPSVRQLKASSLHHLDSSSYSRQGVPLCLSSLSVYWWSRADVAAPLHQDLSLSLSHGSATTLFPNKCVPLFLILRPQHV